MQADRKTRLLALVDDDDAFVDRVGELLGGGGAVTLLKTRTADGLLDLLEAEPVECILLDHDLGDDNGFHVAELVRQRINHPPPMIMLASGAGERTAIKALRAGLFDYLTKNNLTAAELTGAIDRAINADRWARFRVDGAAPHAGPEDHDSATGFYSRAFVNRYMKELNLNRRGAYGVVMLKIARFEEIRRRWGLPVAEQVFRFFVLKLRATAREGDFWGRTGGASFVCVTHSDPAPGEMRSMVERLTEKLSYEQRVGNLVLRISPAAGAAHARGGSDANIVFKRAASAAREAEIGVEVGVAPLVAEYKDPDDAPARTETPMLRRRVFKRAHIVSENSAAAIECVVRGLSSDGATLRFADHFSLPQTMKVKIGGDATYRPAQLRWQEGCDAEVQFLDSKAA